MNNYYQLSSWHVAKDRPLNSRWMINDDKISSILKRIPQLRLSIDTSPFYKKLIYDISKEEIIKLTIIEIKDNWYFVKITHNKKKGSWFIVESSITYKCDQFDSVVKCIRKEVIKKYQNILVIDK